jgi:tetratricopeptide (TPR) repeat protein
MSLLMKALEKAAKDRVDARVEPASAPAPAAAAAMPDPARTELTLEPIAHDTPPTHPSERGGSAAGGLTRGGGEAGGFSAGPARPAAPAAAAREPAQAQASAVLQAGAASHPDRGMVDTLRAHPLLVMGSLAALFAAGFGIYVYLQIARPAISVGRPPLAVNTPAPPPAEAPRPPAPAPAALQEPLAAAPLLREAAVESAAARRRNPAPAAAAEDAGPRSTVVVSRGSAEPAMHPLLGQAYAALQSGQLDRARRDYSVVAGAEPKNIDALLGLAAIAVRIGDNEEATRRYLQVLEIDPRHALAQAGLIALLGRADPQAAESRLRHLISLEPSAHLYFILGNLYADQSQWAAAQHAYFQAHHLEPANPDYAYNLAVGLEHVSQSRLALGYYRRAVELAAARGRANFSTSQAQERIGDLAAQLQ